MTLIYIGRAIYIGFFVAAFVWILLKIIGDPLDTQLNNSIKRYERHRRFTNRKPVSKRRYRRHDMEDEDD